ncbi:3'-5' exonuclease [Staphylococcus muscae]|uniref:3'-5' exonuclease n=1 Tax=Staphylococcus muscae TaxID=1294 RepID=UPI0020122A52|nr:exonuclease domain-containing protein [Staphylococcus muscae]
MKKYDIAVIDFETMNEHTNSPCQVAISLIKDLSVEYIYNSYINPPNNFYSQENANIHQIPKEVILTAPSFDSIFDKIEKLLNESFFVVAHNANFDISVLNHTANTYNLTPKNFLYIDSVNIFKYFHQNISVSMNSLCDIYNIEKSGLHSAKYDVEALSKLLISLMKNEGFSSFLELIQSMKTQYIRFSKLANVQYTIKNCIY